MTMIKNQSKLVKLLHADRRGPLVEAAVLTRCKDVGDHGVETVAFTFFVFKVTPVWKDITNVTLAAKAVTALRAELGPSGVVLTAQMEELLKTWESGAMLQEAAAQPSTSGEACVGEPALAQESATVAEPASAAVSAGPPAAMFAVGSGNGNGAKRLTLAERAKAAKRQCV